MPGIVSSLERSNTMGQRQEQRTRPKRRSSRDDRGEHLRDEEGDAKENAEDDTGDDGKVKNEY